MSDISNRTIVALLAVALVVSVAGTMYSVSELGQVSTVFRTISGLADFDDGNITLDLEGVVAIVVHEPTASLGSGFVQSGQDKCKFSSGGAIAGENWNGLNVNQDNGNCGKDFANASKRVNAFHLIENTGNLDANVSAAIIDVKSGGASIGDDSCAFLTGIDDSNNDGTGGCDDGSLNTRADVDVALRLEVQDASSVTNGLIDGVTTIGATSASEFDDTQVSYDARTSLSDVKNATAGAGYRAGYMILDDFEYESHKDEVAVGFGYTIPSDAIPGVRTVFLEYSAIRSGDND